MNLLYNKKVFNIFLWVLITLVVTTLLITSFLGVNLEDEGFYAILSNPFQEYILSPVNFDLLYKWIYSMFNIQFNISELRLLRIAITITGAIVFYDGLKSISDFYKFQNISRSIFLLIVVLLSFYSSYNLPILTIGYNEFAFLGIQIFTGSLFALMFKCNTRFYQTLLSFGLIFLGFILLFISKPTGIPFLFLLSLVITIYDFNFSRFSIFLFIWVVIISTIILYPLSPRLEVKNLNKVYNIMRLSSTSHSLTNLIKNLMNGSLVLIASFFAGYFYVLIKEFSLLLKTIIFFFLASAIFYDFYQFITNNQSVLNLLAYYITVKINYVISISLAFIYGLKIAETSYNRLTILYFWILSVLLCLSFYFGTDNYLMFIFPKTFVFFTLAIIPICKGKISTFYYLILSVLLFKFFFNLLFFNFFLRQSMFSQTKILNYGINNGSKIFVDSVFKQNQLVFNNQVNKYNEKFVLGFDRLETYIYLSGKVYPGSILWGDEDLHDYFRYRFSKPKSFILVVRGEQLNKIKDNLKDYNIIYYAKEPMIMYTGINVDFNFYYCNKK